MLNLLRAVAVVGFLLSLYSFWIEKHKKAHPEHKAICDIQENISCSKAFSSPYGHLFGISNALLGLGFYLFILAVSFTAYVSYLFYFSMLSMVMTLYLIYVTYFRLKNYCLVCHGIYIVNIALLIITYGLR